MDILFPAVYAKMSADSELDGLTSSIRQFRQPEDPAQLSAPAVVFRQIDAEDQAGLHGAATNPEIEVSVWGYGANMYPNCVRAAQRISELFLDGPTLPSGAQTRWGEITGWQTIDQPNPDTILLRAAFRSRYWSAGRTAVLAAQQP